MRTFMQRITLAAALAVTALASPVLASSGVVPPKQDWTFNGPTGYFEKAALKRGYQVYANVCVSCHSLQLVAYRNLAQIGFDENQIREFAASVEVEDGPNDEGEMFMRPGLPSDHFVPPFKNEKAARSANGGAFPPDLSLIVKARKHDADYLYGLLVGYKDELPEGVVLNDGMSFNEYFPGHQIAMPPPLSEGAVEFEDGTPATVDQMARDLTTFLAWTASPEMETRKSMGIKVVIFLLVLSGMLYAVKKKIWANLH